MSKSLVQANPTLDKMSTRLGLAGAGSQGAILAGLGGRFEITLEANEILDQVRIFDEYSFNQVLNGSYIALGEGRQKWYVDIVFGTDTSSGAVRALRNYIEWTIRKKYSPNPTGEPSPYELDRPFFNQIRNYSAAGSASLYDVQFTEASGCTWRDDQKWLYVVSDNGYLKIVDKNGVAQYGNIPLPASLGFNDPEAIVYLGSDRFAVLDEGAFGSRSPKLILFHLAPGDLELNSEDVKSYELDQVAEFAGGLGAEGLAYDPKRKKFYVGTQPTGDGQGGLWEIDIWNRDTDGKPIQTLLYRWYDILVSPGYLGAGALLGDLEFSRELSGGQVNDSVFCHFRNPDGGGPASQRKVIQVAIDPTTDHAYISELNHGYYTKVEGFAIADTTEELFFVREGGGTNFYRWEHTGYEVETTFKKQFYVKDPPAYKGGLYLAGQEAQLGEAVVFINPSDSNPKAKDATFGINILPTFNDEFFTQHEYVGNRYAQTLRNWGGAATVEVFLDSFENPPVIPEQDIADLAGYYWTAPTPGLHLVIVRLRASIGSSHYVDISGYIRFKQFECPES